MFLKVTRFNPSKEKTKTKKTTIKTIEYTRMFQKSIKNEFVSKTDQLQSKRIAASIKF